MLRELERKLPDHIRPEYEKDFILYKKMLEQKRKDKNKLYSIHEPHIYCMSKGKEHKKYEFGTKVSISKTRESNIIIGALAFKENIYDGHSLEAVLEQIKRISQYEPKIGIVDRGYKGRVKVGNTRILSPKPAKKNSSTKSIKEIKKRFRRRTAIESVIGHLKSDYRLKRNFLKGFIGDEINVLIAAAAWNFNKWIRQFIFCFIFIHFHRFQYR